MKKVITFLALILISVAVFSQMTFVSDGYMTEIDGNKAETEKQTIITIDRGHVRWVTGSGAEDYTNLLLDFKVEDNSGDNWTAQNWKAIDKGGNECVFSIAYFDEGRVSIGIFSDDFSIIFKGEFKDKPKTNKKWDALKILS